MASQLSRKRTFESPAIPDRLYFKIGDVARICEIETYVLRFWETQFPQLKPNKSGTGQRLYRRSDVELALEIKRLVHGEGYTIAGARQALGQEHRGPGRPRTDEARPKLQPLGGEAGKRIEAATAAIGQARAELREIAGMLGEPAQQSQPQGQRRKARVTTLPVQSGSLFPL